MVVSVALLAGPAAAHHRPSHDDEAPRIEIESPASGAELEQGSDVDADFACEDENGVRLCIGTVPDGDPIATGKLGEYSFRVVALDGAGNWSSLTHKYRVVEEPPDDPPPDEAPPDEEPPGDDPLPPDPPAPNDPPAPPVPTAVDPAPAAVAQSGRPVVAPPTNRTTRAKRPVPRTRRATSMRPAAGTRLAGLQPRLRWRELAGATLYNVQLFEWRTKRWVKVRSLFPRRASVRVGRALRPGRRHAWQVWPWKGGSYQRSAVRVSYFDTPAAGASRLLSPRATRVAQGRPLVVRWKPAPGRGPYTVTVKGATSFSMRTARTRAVIPARAVKRGALRLEITRGSTKTAGWVSRRLSAR